MHFFNICENIDRVITAPHSILHPTWAGLHSHPIQWAHLLYRDVLAVLLAANVEHIFAFALRLKTNTKYLVHTYWPTKLIKKNIHHNYLHKRLKFLTWYICICFMFSVRNCRYRYGWNCSVTSPCFILYQCISLVALRTRSVIEKYKPMRNHHVNISGKHNHDEPFTWSEMARIHIFI